ncbi:MAG TPA: hypothetical protein VNC79_06030 [Mycobacteriales bacterium]|nr:hypothetical protein [Mycobacteriales bacterium]
MQPLGDTDRIDPRGRASWLALGLAVLAAGVGCMVWVTYGPPARLEGAAAVVRYSGPVAYAALVGAAVCLYRARRGR